MRVLAGLMAGLMLMAGPAFADPPAAEVEQVMRDYIRLWNAGDGAAITTRIYRFDDTSNAMQTKEGFDRSYAGLKARGYDHSDLHSIDACLLSANMALAEMRYSRMRADGTPFAANLTTLYKLRKTPDGWRIAEMIQMDSSAVFDCKSYRPAPAAAPAAR